MILGKNMSEYEKLQEFRKLMWSLAWTCSTDWMVMELERIERLVGLAPMNDEESDETL
jgi:hypothetical protein